MGVALVSNGNGNGLLEQNELRESARKWGWKEEEGFGVSGTGRILVAGGEEFKWGGVVRRAFFGTGIVHVVALLRNVQL